MPPDGAGQNNPFEVFSVPNKVVDGLPMGYANDVLSDDRTVVEFFGDVVARCSNDFYSPAEC